MTEERLQVDIRPEVNILSVLRHLNYKPWFALAEFVDNSLGSYLASPSLLAAGPLKVSIEIYTEGDGRIVVTDNAAGIRVEDFGRAFRAAQVPPDRSGLSEFGMGMKSAASWFARTWKVRTTTEGDEIERAVVFDLAKITEQRLNQLEVQQFRAQPSSHFTVIELTGLNHIPQTMTLTKIKSHLTSIYRQFLRDGTLELTFRGERLAFKEVDSLVAPRATEIDGESVRWVKPVKFTLSGGQQVAGFAGVRAVGSTSQAGFALFRRGRLILGSHDEPYRPVEIFGQSNTYRFQRLYGELTLTGFEVSHTKDGFRWDEQEQELHEELLRQLRTEPLNLFAQASEHRAKSSVDLIAPIEKAVTNVAVAVEDHFDSLVERSLTEPITDTLVPDELETVRIHKSIRRQVEFRIDSGLWIVDIETTLESSASDWLQVSAIIDAVDPEKGAYSKVDLVVSLAHPFSQKFLGPSNENSELLVAVGSAFGLALALGKLNGAKSYSILHHLNTLLRETFATVTGQEGT